MPDGWITGAVRIDGTKDGQAYRTDVPWRHVWHTMEAPADTPPGTGPWGSISGLVAYIKAHLWPPHIWCWPERDWVGQTINLYRSAYALEHSWSGYPETNHARAIQVEILGYARDAPCIEHAEWLGRRVLRPVIDEGIPINLLRWAPSTGSDGAGTNGTVRLPADVWYEFDGQCGHANVPRNQHWDPGRADYVGIARAAGGQPPEDDLTPEQAQTLDRIAYATTAFYRQGKPGDGRFYVEKLVRPEVDAALVPVTARLAALEEAIAQLGAGGTIDYGKVQDAAEAAVREVQQETAQDILDGD